MLRSHSIISYTCQDPMTSFLTHAKIPWLHFSYMLRSHSIISHTCQDPMTSFLTHAKIPWLHFSFLHSTIHNHESSTCFHEHSTTYIGMRSKDTHVMQLHMLFTHSNNNNNHDNIHINKKFKPTHKAKTTTTYSRV
ncbi:hypothetical protein GQ457_12G008360 [Hibiscus cannabinus]